MIGAANVRVRRLTVESLFLEFVGDVSLKSAVSKITILNSLNYLIIFLVSIDSLSEYFFLTHRSSILFSTKGM